MQVIKVDNHILTSKNSMFKYLLCAFCNISKIFAETAFGGGSNFSSNAIAEIITGYNVDKLWDDGLLIQTTQVEESMLLNCDRMEDGRVSILEEKPLLFVRNTLNLIK
uniref:Bm9843 n=1 Tax=Brugia malayi TaxID=6279 RepID=A0A1I9GCN4_BRUMA|nr:Bm9843 [Brugia malayi]